ncbi:MAG: DNA primase catalytic subunit PriS [Euryarchaeota archaeon]|nr:DNA primase catalytic subunit PriS [Euryarchaeota archaeon]
MENVEFLKGAFRRYYLKETVSLPPRFTRREYGFMFFDKKYVLRHKGFKTLKEIRRFMVDNVPRHAYYSTAYYSYPDTKDMEKKGWLGADLIFDLDADHLPETEGMNYLEMMGVVKKEAHRLVKDFLMDDFGFDEESLSIAFSGGRGFHIYVRRKDIFTLGSDERREIVNYITGEGVDMVKLLESSPRESRRKGGSGGYVLELPPVSKGGWYRKLTVGITTGAQELYNIYTQFGKEGLVAELDLYLKNKKLSKKLARKLLEKTPNYSTKIELLAFDKESKKLQVFGSDALRDAFLLYIKEKIRIRGETDEPVTTDIHRLIRLIGSLHGKTGFIVRALSYNEFKDFNPANPNHILEFLVPKIFKENEVKIISKGKINLPFDVSSVDGEVCVPEYAAIFAVARGMADFITKC